MTRSISSCENTPNQTINDGGDGYRDDAHAYALERRGSAHGNATPPRARPDARGCDVHHRVDANDYGPMSREYVHACGPLAASATAKSTSTILR